MAAYRGFTLCFVLAVFLTVCVDVTEPKWVEGTIDTDSGWVFITRFCFLSRIGRMQYYVEYPVGYAIEKMAFYYDVPGQWDSVYKKGLTCEAKMDALQGRNQFSLSFPESLECKTDNRSSGDWYVCEGSMNFNAARERWWYIVITRCGQARDPSLSKVYAYYKLHLTNGDDFLHKEYSADEFYIFIVDLIFFVLYIKIMVLSIVCAVILKKKQLLHTTYKMYMIAVTIWTLHLLCEVIAWGSYGTTGWEMRQLEVFGRILQAVSNIIFMLMLILMAKGYTIVRGRLSTKAVVKITVFINLYIVASVILFIWEGVLFDPGVVLYYYESPPGYGMIAIVLIGWLWFTKAAVFTLKHYKSKTYFYIAFYSIYTVWFWAGPFVILIAMFAMAKWTREKTVNGVQQFIAYVGHLIFLILTMPSKANDNFPYHIRTTQIGAMSGRNEDEQGAYSISGSGEGFSGIGPNLELFITSKAQPSDTDANGDTMYRPLSRGPASSRSGSGDSPPPSYQAVSAGRNFLPPIGSHGDGNGNINNGYNGNMSNHNIDLLGQRNSRLPPLQQAIHGDRDDGEDIVLPPLRGTGLPPIIPSAPPTASEANYETAPTTPHTDLFRVDNK